MTTVASLDRVTYSYPAWADRPAPALSEVSLDLDGGMTLVSGDSGAGKSTLLRCLNGLVPHFHGGVVSGRASVAGLDVLSTPTRELARHVGFVFQEPESGFVRGTVEREVAFGPESLGLAPAVIRRQAAAAMEELGIAHLAGRRLRTLSGGERQRVALAGALAVAPEIVALDEPTSQLDATGSAALVGLLEKLAGSGRAVVVAEHRLRRFAGVERVVTVTRGQVTSPVGERALEPVRPPRSRRDAGALEGPESFSLSGVTFGVAGRALADGVELSAKAGQVLVLTGANGAGKTTLLRTVAGLLPPLAGRVERRPGRVAYLPQEPGVLLHRASVRAEVLQTLRWSRIEGDGQSALELLGLSDLAERDPRDLSTGQRQRAALAVVLAGRPMLALLDEPTRGMDASARVALGAAIDGLAAGGATVVVATHDDDLALELGGRRLHLESGQLCKLPAGCLL